MTRPARLLLAVLAAVALGAAATVPAAEARTDDLAKPVVFLTGPELAQTKRNCEWTRPMVDALKAARPSVQGQRLSFKGSVRHIAVNAGGYVCRGEGNAAVDGPNLHEVALPVAQMLERMSADGPVDVVAVGSAGIVVRFAMLQSTRSRLGKPSLGSEVYPKALDVEDVVTLGTPHGGSLAPTAACNGNEWCQIFDKAGNPELFAALTAPEGGGKNPQGPNGTDWSVMGFAGDRFTKDTAAVEMDAAHRTVYTEDPKPTKMALTQALADSSDARDQYLRFKHGTGEWTSTTKGQHVAQRVVADLVYGAGSSEGASGPAFARGCTGFNESGGETIAAQPALLSWAGDKEAVRVMKFASVDAVADCFKKESEGVFSVTGPQTLRVNGLDLQLRNALAKVVVDTKQRTVRRVSGVVELMVPVGGGKLLPLWTFDDDSFKATDLNWRYPAVTSTAGQAVGPPIVSDDGARVSYNSNKFKLGGMDVKGNIALTVVKGATQLSAALTLPGYFSSNLAASGPPQCSNGSDDDKDGTTDKVDKDCGVPGADGKPVYDPNLDFEDRTQASGVGFTVGTTNREGLMIEKVNGRMGGAVRFGPLRAEGGLGVEWSRADAEFKITIDAAFPALNDVALKLRIGVKDGALTAIYGEASNLNVPLWSSGLFLQKVGLGASGFNIEGKQKEFQFSTAISFLRRIAGKYTALVNGDLTVGWGQPWKFKLDGSVALIDKEFGSGSLEYTQGVGGRMKITLGRTIPFGGTNPNDPLDKPLFEIKPTGTLSGVVSTTGELDLGAQISLCVKGDFKVMKFDDDWCAAKSDLRMTKFDGQPFHQAFCFFANVPLLGRQRIGFVSSVIPRETGLDATFDWVAGSCDVARWGNKAVKAQAGEAPGFTSDGQRDVQVVGVTGRGGPPDVVLVGPNGERIAGPKGAPVVESDVAVAMAGPDQVAFFLKRPAAGRWRVEAQPGSVPLGGVRTTEMLPKPEVRASVRRDRQGRFVLDHTVVRQPGQEVRFVERSADLVHELARSTGGRGTRRFRPSFGPGGVRRVVAVVLQDGKPRTELDVARFRTVAPAKPGRVRGLALSRRGARPVATWKAAPGATGGYVVSAQLPDGRSYARFVRRGRRVVLPAVTVPGRVEVAVRGVRREDELPGPITRARR